MVQSNFIAFFSILLKLLNHSNTIEIDGLQTKFRGIKDYHGDLYREIVRKTGVDPAIFWQETLFFDVPLGFTSISVRVDLQKRFLYGLSDLSIDRNCKSHNYGKNRTLHGSVYLKNLTKSSSYSVRALNLEDHGNIKITLSDVRADFHTYLNFDSLKVYSIALDNFTIRDSHIHVEREGGSEFVGSIVDAVMATFKNRFEEDIEKKINRIAQGTVAFVNEEKLIASSGLKNWLKMNVDNNCIKI